MSESEKKRGLSQWFRDHWESILSASQWLVPGLGALLSTWLATLTSGLDAYAPFSYVIAFVIGGLATSLILGAIQWFRAESERREYLRDLQRPSDSVNPLDSTFNKRRINVASLGNPTDKVVENKTFTDCEFVGPNIVLFGGCHFDGKLGTGNCDFVVLRDDLAAIPTINVIVFRGCYFRNCEFHSLVLMMNKQSSDVWDKISGGRITWLTAKTSQQHEESQPQLPSGTAEEIRQ